MVHAVVTGGGTSGHVVPAQAILEALREAGHDASTLRYVGSRRGMETTLMADSGVESVFLPVSGLQRSLSPTALARNLAFLWRLARSRVMAGRLVRSWSPGVVVSVGGYASAPMSMAAVRAGVPLVCVSYDRAAGLATRRQARHAVATAVAFADTDLPRAVHTGAPVRSVMRHLDVARERGAARRRLGVPEDAVCLTVMGGSLGSKVLNDSVGALVEACAATPNLAVVHICGARNIDDPAPVVPAGVHYVRCGYVTAMQDVYAATDVMVCRAGASTVAEVATVGVAAVLVPWQGASEDHQSRNAAWLGDNGAAVVIAESRWARSEALETVAGLVGDPTRREQLATAARRLGALHRGDSLVAVIENASR